MSKNLDLFLYWINERHKIYLKKQAKEPKPWTKDTIFQEYKFTNVFRELDKTTIWMRENVTEPHRHSAHDLMVFNCGAFRYTGTPEAYNMLGWITEFKPLREARILEEARQSGKKIFTSAYMITNMGSTIEISKRAKTLNVCDIFLRHLWKKRFYIADIARTTKSLEQTHNAFLDMQGWGGRGFMAYEVVSDLLYTPVLEGAIDQYQWANPGPGAFRGINRVEGLDKDTPRKKQEAIDLMYSYMKIAQKEVEKHVPSEKIDMRAIEHSLCEFDKYCRVLRGEGKPRSRYPGKL